MQEVSEGARGEVGGWGEAKGEKVSRVCAHGAAREGRAPQRAAVKAYTGGGGRWWSGCAGGGRKVFSAFNTVFVSLLLLAAGVGFPAACLGR